MNGVDPSKVVRKAIAETLVFYYPFAGRLREGPSGKLTLECTGEGVLFIEADADVSLQQFGEPLAPPFPCSDQLLFDVPGSNQILNSPLVLVQVTRLKCGGFILGLRYNHVMSDGPGLLQFMTAIGEAARGAKVPSLVPTWERHALNSPPPQPVTSPPPAHQNNPNFPLQHDLRYRAFLFSPNDILALRGCLPSDIHKCSSFEIVAACVWKCRVVALQPHPNEEMSFIWPVNMRGNFNRSIPPGYYGNAMVFSISSSTAKEIVDSPLSYTLGLLRKAQITITEHNYTRAVSDLMMSMRSYLITDLRYAGFEKVDLG